MRNAFGRGIATIAHDQTLLDTWFPHLGLGNAPKENPDFTHLASDDPIREITRRIIDIAIDLDVAPKKIGRAHV